MSVGLDIEAKDLERLQKRLLAVSHVKFTELLEGIGAIVENQSRNRIQNTKTGPDGTKWKDWSEAYAASKHGAKNHEPHPGQLRSSQGHTLLSLSGGLLDSLQDLVTFDEVEIGSNLIYANVQNEARPFLGLSSSDSDEIYNVINDFLDREMGLT